MARVAARGNAKLWFLSLLSFSTAAGIAVACGGSEDDPLLGTPPAPTASATSTADGSSPPTGGTSGTSGNVTDSGSGDDDTEDSGPGDDSGTDSGIDSGTDSGVPNDGGLDGGGPGDAGLDGGPDASTGCTKPKANCSGNKADGCNVDLDKDNANCGGCGIVCAGGCDKGICPLIQNVGGPPTVGSGACFAIDDTNAYIANGRGTPNGAVGKVALNGGPIVPLATGQATPHGIAVDRTTVYFTSAIAAGSISSVPIDASATATVIVTAQNRPNDIAVQGASIYWIDIGDAASSGGSLWRAQKSGNGAAQLGPALGDVGGHLRVSTTTIYFTVSDYGIGETHIAGPTHDPSAVIEGPNSHFLDIDDTHIFFSAGNGAVSTVRTGPIGGNDDKGNDIATSQASAMGVAIDGTHVYWANAGSGGAATDGEIWRSDLDGKNATKLASNRSAPTCIAVDGKSVYWLDNGTGVLAKTAK